MPLGVMQIEIYLKNSLLKVVVGFTVWLRIFSLSYSGQMLTGVSHSLMVLLS